MIDESIENETLKERETLEALAVKIARYANEADDKTLEAAKLIREARKRVDAGEASDPNWYSWAAKNIKLSQSRLRELQPRGSKNCKTIVREIANEMHAVTEDGRLRRRSILEFMLLALRNRGAEGDVRAFCAFKKYLAKYDSQETDSKLGYIVLSADVTPEEAIAEGETANAEARARRAAESRE